MPLTPALTPIMMLFASNVFMTFAWYGHLRYKAAPLALAILASWGIAFIKYSLAVPANRSRGRLRAHRRWRLLRVPPLVSFNRHPGLC